MQQDGLMSATDYIRLRLGHQISRAVRVLVGAAAVVAVGRLFYLRF